MTVDKLKAYCKRHDIFVPHGATKKYLISAIYRFNKQSQGIEVDKCFGLWEHEYNECMVCKFEKECKTMSLGMDADVYDKKSRGRL